MAQQFGALVAPVEDSGLIPTLWLTTSLILVPGDMMFSSCL